MITHADRSNHSSRLSGVALPASGFLESTAPAVRWSCSRRRRWPRCAPRSGDAVGDEDRGHVAWNLDGDHYTSSRRTVWTTWYSTTPMLSVAGAQVMVVPTAFEPIGTGAPGAVGGTTPSPDFGNVGGWGK